MDGAIMGAGGGFELGAGFVTIGVDLDPLRDGVAQTERLVADLVGKSYVVKFEADLGSIGPQLSLMSDRIRESVADAVSSGLRAGMGGGGGFAAPSGLQQLYHAASGVTAVGGGGFGIGPAVGGIPFHQPPSAFMGAYGAAPAMMGLEAPSADASFSNVSSARFAQLESRYTAIQERQYSALEDAVSDAESQLSGSQNAAGVGPSGRGGGSGGSRGGFGRGRSPLSLYGISNRLGLGIGAVVAGIEAINLAGGILRASDIQQNSSDFLYGLDSPGSSIDAFGALGGIGRQQAGLAATNEIWRSVESVPLIGGLLGNLDVGQASRQRTMQALGREASGTVYEMGQADSLRIGIAGAAGDSAGAAQIQQDIAMRMRAANIQRAQRDYAAAHRSFFGTVANGGDDAMDLANRNYDSQAQLGSILVEQARREQIGSSQSITGGILGAAYATAASGYQLQSTRLLTAGGAGAQLAAMQLERQALSANQRGEIERFGGDTGRLVGAAKPELRAGVQEMRDTELAELKAKQAEQIAEYDRKIVDAERATQRELTSLQAQGSASRLEAVHAEYEAKLSTFEANATNTINGMVQAGRPAAEIYAAETSFNQQRDAMLVGENERIGNLSRSITARQAAAGFTMQRMPLQAQLARMAADEAGRISGMNQDPAMIAREMVAYGMERQNAIFQDQRGIAIGGFELSAQTQAANLTTANEPMAAAATRAIAQARVAVANADPRLRTQTIEAQTAQLQAMMHEQFGFRSGAMSQAYTLDEALGATGFGMDLGGTSRDRRAAQAALNAGIGQLGNAIPGTTPTPFDPKSIEDAIVKAFQGALSRVTLFTTGS